ncbi:MAG: HDIG domain-containing metalloprotein [Pseudomonadota bacterium]
MTETPKDPVAGVAAGPNVARRFGLELRRLLGHEAVQRWAMLAAVSFTISVLAYPRLLSGGHDFHIGEQAGQSVRASRDFLVEDKQSTEVRREAAAEAVPPVYDLDEEALALAIRRLNSAMQRDRRMEREVSAPGLAHAERTEFERLFGSPLEAQTFQALRESRFSPELERLAITLASRVMVGGVGKIRHQQPIIVREVVAGQERQIDDPSVLPDLKAARLLTEQAAQMLRGPLPDGQVAAAAELAKGLLITNLGFNKAETELRRVQARVRVRPVFFQVKKGEIIVREGEKVRPEDLLKLSAEQQGKGSVGPEMVLGVGLLLAIFLALTYYIANLHGRREPLAGNKDLLLLCVVLLLVFLGAKAALFIGEALGRAYPWLQTRAVVYAMPVSAGAMLVALFLSLRQALFFCLATSVTVAMLVEGQLDAFLYFFLGSLVAASSVSKVRERPALVRAGLVVGVTNILVVAALAMSSGTFFTIQGPVEAAAGLLGGLAAGIIVIGLTPVVEMAFHYVTDMRLQELINLDQPLLRDLTVAAPGTYHHSVVVSNMVEAAADSVGANGLVAKVSAYYHDIGKTRKPQFFIENQEEGTNRHEKLTPSMSALIIAAHVKDGVEMAAAKGLDKRIIDIIRQHHGTALISFFYQKAKTLKGDANVSEAEYRYPGPKPQTKEAGLVMLADAVEAACRTLPDPTPDRIQGLVQRVINGIFCDGQMDESELTLRDLHSIAASFNKTLGAMYHQRVEYPDAERAKKNGEAEGGERARNGEDQPGASAEKDRQNIRRLGLS